MKKKVVGAIVLAGLVALQMPMVALADDKKITIAESGSYSYGEHEGSTYGVVTLNGGGNEINATITDYIDYTQTGGYNGQAITNNNTNANTVLNITGENAEGASIAFDYKHNYNFVETVDWWKGSLILKGDVQVTNSGSNAAVVGVIMNSGILEAENIIVNNQNANDTQALRYYDMGTTQIEIANDVTAIGNKGQGLVIEDNWGLDPTIKIGGTLYGEQYAITVYGDDTRTDNTYVYALESDGQLCNSSVALSNINYIIRGTGDNNADYSNISSITGSTVQENIEIRGNNYYSSKQGEITVTVNSGYELSAGNNIISVNGNRYIVSIPEGGHVTLATVKKAIQQAEEQAEQRASFTGTADNAVTGGQWNMGPGGYWTFRTDGIFKDTWGNITLENGKTGWFWFDKNGVMAAGWKEINGKWYYFNEAHDGTYGMMITNATTPDGKRVGADGALIQ